MASTVLSQEETGREHRLAYEIHRTKLVALETELAEIEAQLPTADDDSGEADQLLRRRRECQDKIEWLRHRTAELHRKAEAEELRERTIRANTNWAPLAERKVELIDQADAIADQLLPVLQSLDTVSEEQMDVLHHADDVPEMRGANFPSEVRRSNHHFCSYLIRKLGLLDAFPQLLSQLPAAADKLHGQDVPVREKLFTVPPEVR